MIAWLRTLLRLVRAAPRLLQTANEFEQVQQLLREHITVDADVGLHGPNTVIVIGRYRRHDYVQTYHLPPGEFDAVLRHLNDLARVARVRRVDVPPAIRGPFERLLP